MFKFFLLALAVLSVVFSSVFAATSDDSILTVPVKKAYLADAHFGYGFQVAVYSESKIVDFEEVCKMLNKEFTIFSKSEGRSKDTVCLAKVSIGYQKYNLNEACVMWTGKLPDGRKNSLSYNFPVMINGGPKKIVDELWKKWREAWETAEDVTTAQYDGIIIKVYTINAKEGECPYNEENSFRGVTVNNPEALSYDLSHVTVAVLSSMYNSYPGKHEWLGRRAVRVTIEKQKM